MSNSESKQNRERRHFDMLADNCGEIWWGSTTLAGIYRLRRRSALIKRELELKKNISVLEIGCGTGALTRYVLEIMPDLSLFCCDVSGNSIAIARKRYVGYRHAKFFAADVTALPFQDNHFDMVIGNSILHHLPLDNALRECRRVLRNDGVAVFFEPNMLNPQIAIEKNIKFVGKLLQNSEEETAFFRWRLAADFIKCGFRSVNIEPFDFLHPAIPSCFIGGIQWLGAILEKAKGFKEISGSLFIKARK
jgi:SAM-dependent methyltransferase